MDMNGKSLPPEKKRMLLFMMLVQQHEEIAKMNLGEIPNPAHNRHEEDLKTARYAIDTLEMLLHYTTGNLSSDEHGFLEGTWSRLNKSLNEKSKPQ